jgi:predicted NBD/HSP70 family sugar kinase
MNDMILGIDIGGTKTCIGLFKENGELADSVKFPTHQDYATFIESIRENAENLALPPDAPCVTAVAGLLNREEGTVEVLGNLPWKNKPIANDIASALHLPEVKIENDSKLAGLAEARHLPEEYRRITYFTLSTGIGGALVIRRNLAQDIIDMEIGKMPLLHENKMVPWEEFTSGRAFVKEFGKPASEVDDEETWKTYASYLSQGLTVAAAVLQTDAIVFGGGLGQYAEKFIPFLQPEFEKLHPIVHRPKLLTSAHYGELSVLYGCYEYARDTPA